MDINSIFEAGGIQIPNPEWSKSNKNKVPKYITVSDIDRAKPTSSGLASSAMFAAKIGSQDILGTAEELDKYEKYGITPNDFEDLHSQLVDKQSAVKKFGNSLAQALVSETVLGTFKGFSDLFDLIGSVTGLTDEDYSNPVTQYLEEKQEEFRNFAPIYSDPNKNILNGGLLDAGWWASNLPSVMSSLTLLIPSTAVVKGASYLGKAGKLGARTRQAVRAISGAQSRLSDAQRLKLVGASTEAIEEAAKFNKVQKFLTSNSTAKQTALFLENGTTATLSRAMENYQEARQTYNDMYADASEHFKNDDNFNKFVASNKDMLEEAGVDTNNKDEVAKYIAKASADRTFQLDWLNVGFDVIQMYGLRNAWKRLKNAPDNPAKVRRANIDAAKYIGKSPDEIAAIKASRKFKEKAKDWTSDRLYGSKLIIGAQLSEGVEEAVNYIASQEGMHFGNVMLGKEIGTNKGVWENIFNGFDGRIEQYALAPELWDSAFWGTIGGIMFQAGGSQVRRLSNRLTEDKSEAAEEAKQKLPWYALGDLPENKRRLTEIESRAQDFNNYKSKLDRINNGEDIYRSTEENTVNFTNESEKQSARDRLKDEFIAQMTLRAMNSGNYDLLRSYLSDDNLRKGFIESGIFGNPNENKSKAQIEQESKDYIDDALRRMSRVERMYDEEITAVDHASSQIATTTKEDTGSRQDVLAEYMQIIATNNVYARLAIDNQQTELNGITSRIGELLGDDTISKKLDPNINYEEHIKVAVLTNELGKLYAQRKRILNDKTNSLSNEISIKEINKQIDNIEKELTDSQLVLATNEALRYTLGDDGKYSQENTPESFAYNDAMIAKRGEVAVGTVLFNDDKLLNRLSKRAKTVIDDSVFGEYEVGKQDFESALSRFNTARTSMEESETGIKELDNLYQRKAAISQSIKNLYNNISKTVDEVSDAAGILHNTMNEARKNAIDEANSTILELYKKYGSDIRTAIREHYYNNTRNYNETTNKLTEEESRRLYDALTILDITKSHNKSLIDVLEGTFELEDMINSAKEDQTETVESQENYTNSQADTSTNDTNLDNTTGTNTQSNTAQTDSQNGNVSQPIDPQQTENRTPAFYTEFYNTKGKFISKKASSTDNGKIAVYNNGDGTYTLDVRGDVAKLNDNRFFGNTAQVDLLRPYEVVRKPIARRNVKGNLEIAQTGELRNTDTLEYQEEQLQNTQTTDESIDQSTEQQTPSNETIEEEQPNVDNTEVEAVDQTNPSTGVVVDEAQTQPEPNIPTDTTKSETTTEIISDIIIEEQSVEDDIRNESLGIFQKEYKNDHNVNLNEVAEQTIDFYVKQGYPRDVVEVAVNKSKNIIERVIARRKNNSNNSMLSSITEVMFEQINPFEKAYKDSVKNMIEQYAKEFRLEKHNEKLYINLEDLLRFVNTVSSDDSTANLIFSSLKSYLSTDEAKREFIIIDESETNSVNFLDNVRKPAEQRYLERIKPDNSQRVDIEGIITSFSTQKELDDFYEALDKINRGDKLKYTIDNNKVVIRNNKGQAVGTLPIPKVNKSTGAFQMINDGWVTDVLSTNNGEIISKLKDTFLRWFDPSNNYAKELNDMIYELSYDRPTEKRKQELLEKFNNNPEIKLAKANGVISSTASTKQLINGLVKLWRYRDYNSIDTTGKQNRNIRRSLNAWFEKMLDSYNGVMTLVNQEVKEVTVSNISDGEIIRISDKNAYNTALPVNKAIAGGVNTDVHKISISNRGTLLSSGIANIPFSESSNNSTFVLFPNRNGTYDYVHAYPAEVTDDYISDTAKDIMSSMKSHITNLFNEFNNDVSEDNFNNIKDFFIKALYNANNKQSLFFNIATFDKGNFFVIEHSKAGRKIVINRNSNEIIVTNPEFEADSKGRHQKPISLDNPEAYRHINELINSLRFNITPTYIISDNDKNLSLTGIATRTKEGKFKITIGDKNWTFDSYNDFLLTNNLVRLNTKPNKEGTSNYSRKGIRSQKGNQVFNISLDTSTTTPVEEQQKPTTPVTKPTITITEEVENIIKGNTSEHKGIDIAKLIYDEKTLNSFVTLNILPKNIIFDSNLNTEPGREDINASVNPTTGQVIVGTKWFDLFKDLNTRPEAIRKLIHEQLHIRLVGHEKFIDSAKEIYNEFKEYLDANNIPEDNYIRAYLFSNENPRIALEEFLVESLTSDELARYLNNIDAKVETKRGARNFLQKILEFMSKLFGWDIRKGSLYEKELHVLRESFNKPVKQVISDNVQIETIIEQEEIKSETSNEEIESKPNTIIVESEDTINNTYGEDFSDDLLDEFDSSITESNLENMEYTPEMQSIKDKAIADGTFMKSPKGNPTNLNERQWLQVRTENFINWFGDWINNPSKASKVVDDNGEPLVVYHGSPNSWTVYDSNLFSSTTDDGYYGKGLYLSSVENKAKQYGRVISLFVNIKTPIRIGIDKTLTIDETTKNIELAENFNRDGNLSEYDGVLYSGSEGMYEEIVVPTANQIKSATFNTGEFSTTNNDIRYSSITESKTNIASNIPSVQSMQDRLPIEQRENFASLVASAVIESSCR